MPGSLDKETTLWLRQKVKQDKLTALYRHINITGNLDLTNLDGFKLTIDPKKGTKVFEFYNSDKWVSLTEQTRKFLAVKKLRDRFGGVNAIKSFLGIDETRPALERSFNPASKLKRELLTVIEMEVHLL